MQASTTHTHRPEDAKLQTSAPSFGSRVTVPILHLPEVSGPEAACTPRPAQPSRASEHGKHQLGGSQRMSFYRNQQLAGLALCFQSQQLTFSPAVQHTPVLCPASAACGTTSTKRVPPCQVSTTPAPPQVTSPAFGRSVAMHPSPAQCQGHPSTTWCQTGARQLRAGITHPVPLNAGERSACVHQQRLTSLHCGSGHPPLRGWPICWSAVPSAWW